MLAFIGTHRHCSTALFSRYNFEKLSQHVDEKCVVFAAAVPAYSVDRLDQSWISAYHVDPLELLIVTLHHVLSLAKPWLNGYIDQSSNSEKSCVNFSLSFKALLIASVIRLCTMLYVIWQNFLLFLHVALIHTAPFYVLDIDTEDIYAQNNHTNLTCML